MTDGAPELEVIFDEKQVSDLIAKVGRAVETDLANLALKAARAFEGPLRREIMTRLAQSPTGALSRSVRSVLVEKGGNIAGAIAGTDTVYAEIQDEGGTIHAKDRRLAVPLRRVPNPPPKGKWPRDWSPTDPLFLLPRPGRDPLLVSPTKGPQYVLKTSVTLQGVGYRDAALKAAGADVEAIIEEGLEEILAKHAGGGGSSGP